MLIRSAAISSNLSLSLSLSLSLDDDVVRELYNNPLGGKSRNLYSLRVCATPLHLLHVILCAYKWKITNAGSDPALFRYCDCVPSIASSTTPSLCRSPFVLRFLPAFLHFPDTHDAICTCVRVCVCVRVCICTQLRISAVRLFATATSFDGVKDALGFFYALAVSLYRLHLDRDPSKRNRFSELFFLARFLPATSR